MPNNIKRRLADQAGFILPTSIIALFILVVLTGAAITVSAQTSTSTTRDDNSKAALEAAEAGLQVAAYRLSQLKPGAGECINGSEKKKAASKSEAETACTSSSTEPLGNGATFQYWTSLPYKETEKCAGQEVTEAQIKAGATLRCITSEGKVNGVTPGTRLQTLVSSSLGESLFTIKGILGLEEVLVSGSVTATAIVASNEKIIGTGSATFEKGFELCPGGTFTPKDGSERNSSGVAVGNVRGGYVGDPPLEKERSSSECPITAALPAAHATATSNQDSRIASGEDPNTGEAKSLLYNASKYELEVGANVKLTLKGSKYYFCKLLVTSNGNLKIATGAEVEIFIGSHTENSTCPKEPKEAKKAKEVTPVFEVAGAASIENPNTSASLLIEMAGEGPLEIGASGSLKASIYAPNGEVVLSGAGVLTGAIVGKKVHLTAGSFIYSTESEKLVVNSSGGSSYPRKSWEQCTPGGGAGTC